MGYKSEQFVKKIDENLFCSICQEVFKDPVSCKRGHTFCRECITKWLMTNRKCPLDNDILEKDNLVRNLIVNNMIDNLEVYCHPPDNDKQTATSLVRSVQTCGWTGKLQDLYNHRKTCPFQQVQCPHENCHKTMQRREIEGHDLVCRYKMVKCFACKKVLIRLKLENHIKDDCPETLVSCPNNCTSTQGETTKIKRIDLNDHLTNVCAKAIVDCPFKDQCCSVQVERQNVTKHVQENMAKHMMLLAKQCSLLTKQNSSLVKENKVLKDELEKVKENLKEPFSSGDTYIWTIDDYPSLAQKHPNCSWFRSPIFWLCGYSWYLKLYPNGRNTESKGSVSIYLYRHIEKLGVCGEEPESNPVIPSSDLGVFYRLSVLSQKPGTDDFFKKSTDTFTKTNNRGFSRFMKADSALFTAYCNSTNGRLTIQCKIQLIKPQ